jgi:hypothetical protein
MALFTKPPDFLARSGRHILRTQVAVPGGVPFLGKIGPKRIKIIRFRSVGHWDLTPGIFGRQTIIVGRHVGEPYELLLERIGNWNGVNYVFSVIMDAV